MSDIDEDRMNQKGEDSIAMYARIAELEAEVDDFKKALDFERDVSRVRYAQLTEANGLLHEIDIWAQCHPAGAFGLRDILAKRKGGA